MRDDSVIYSNCDGIADQKFAGIVYAVDIRNGVPDGVSVSGRIATKSSAETNELQYGETLAKYAHDTWIGDGISVAINYLSINYSGDTHDVAFDNYSFSYVE